MTDSPPENTADHAEDFSHRWADKLDQFAAERMERLGLPPEQIGTSDHLNRVAWRAFFPDEHDGGNVTADGRINVDSGVLDPELLTPFYGEAAGKIWARASLKDRMDAIIIHEEAEHREGTHEAALAAAPLTNRPIGEGARRILRAMEEGARGRS